jgi:WD40 repeat protein
VLIITDDGQIFDGSSWTPPTAKARLAITPAGPAAFTGDGTEIIAACSTDYRSLDVFSTADGRLIRHIAGLPARAALISASADGSEVCVAVKAVNGAPIADDVWFWGPGATAKRLRTSTRTTGIALTPDGRWLAGGFGDVFAWNTAGTEAMWSKPLDHEGAVFAISDDGTQVASGGVDKAISLWKRGVDQRIAAFRGHSGNITALAFDPAGRTLASAGTDLTIRLWDTGTGNAITTLAGHTDRIRSLRFTSDGSCLLSISDDGSIRLWQARPYEATCILRGHSSYVYAAAFTPDGSRIVSGAWDETIRIWDAAGGSLLRTIPTASGIITTLAVSGEGRTIATGHKINEWDPGQVHLWDSDSGDGLGHLSFGNGELHALTFNRAGTRLWAGWEYQGVGTADLTARPLAMTPLASGVSTFAVALSPDEEVIADAGETGRISLRDANTGRLIRDWEAHSGRVTALAFCPTRPLLASGAADSTIRLWSSETGALVAKLDRHWGPVYSLAFSPDGAALASGSDDTTIRIWDTDSADELARLRGHEAYIYSLAFSPDGSRLASASGDHTVRVWDTRPVHQRWAARRP